MRYKYFLVFSAGALFGFILSLFPSSTPSAVNQIVIADLDSISSEQPIRPVQRVAHSETGTEPNTAAKNVLSVIQNQGDLPSALDLLPETLIHEKIDELSHSDILSIADLVLGTSNVADFAVQVDDVKSFSKRVVDELKGDGASVHELSQTQLYFALDNRYPNSDQSFFSITPDKVIYAHFDTGYGLGTGAQALFTRWRQLDTGEVVFFNQKPIVSSQSRNWISFAPEDGWHEGAYEVALYSFDSQLNKLASAIFYIDHTE